MRYSLDHLYSKRGGLLTNCLFDKASFQLKESKDIGFWPYFVYIRIGVPTPCWRANSFWKPWGWGILTWTQYSFKFILSENPEISSGIGNLQFWNLWSPGGRGLKIFWGVQFLIFVKNPPPPLFCIDGAKKRSEPIFYRCVKPHALQEKSHSHQFQTQVSKPKKTQLNLTRFLFIEIWFTWSI